MPRTCQDAPQIMPRTLQYAAKCVASVATMDPASEQTRILRNVFRCSSQGKHDTWQGRGIMQGAWHDPRGIILAGAWHNTECVASRSWQK
jgi:hypothetical protein